MEQHINWDYHFDKGVMTEKFCAIERYYGCWDEYFGYWEGIRGNLSSVAMTIPLRPVLKENGLWIKPSETITAETSALSGLDLSQWKQDADAAYAAFFGTIPSWIRRIAAPFDKYQWLVMEMLWHNSRAGRVFEEIFFSKQTQLFYALAAIQQWENTTRDMRAILSKEIPSINFRTEVSKNYGNDINPMDEMYLASLGTDTKNPETYWSLLSQREIRIH
jgi:hypothetical protein